MLPGLFMHLMVGVFRATCTPTCKLSTAIEHRRRKNSGLCELTDEYRSYLISAWGNVHCSSMILLYPKDDLVYVTSHLGLTPDFCIGSIISYLISEFFHLKLEASRCLVLSMLPPRSSCDGGGEGGRRGGGGATCFLFNKLWNFHTYWLVM